MISKFSLVVCCLLLGILSSQGNEKGKEEPNFPSLFAPFIMNLWKTDHVDFLDHNCLYRMKPKLSNWRFKWDGKFWCPGLAPFSGNSLTRSRSGSVEDAIRDFATKAVQKKILEQEDVDIWLAGYKP